MTFVKTNNRPVVDQWMNQFMNEFSNVFQDGRASKSSLHTPPVNILEQANGYHMELLAPGFNKADFKIQLEANTITIAAELAKDNAISSATTNTETGNSTTNNANTESPKEKVRRKEFSIKPFSRSFQLNEKIDASNISATYENGVLYLHLPIKEAEKNIVKSIEIQ